MSMHAQPQTNPDAMRRPATSAEVADIRSRLEAVEGVIDNPTSETMRVGIEIMVHGIIDDMRCLRLGAEIERRCLALSMKISRGVPITNYSGAVAAIAAFATGPRNGPPPDNQQAPPRGAPRPATTRGVPTSPRNTGRGQRAATRGRGQRAATRGRGQRAATRGRTAQRSPSANAAHAALRRSVFTYDEAMARMESMIGVINAAPARRLHTVPTPPIRPEARLAHGPRPAEYHIVRDANGELFVDLGYGHRVAADDYLPEGIPLEAVSDWYITDAPDVPPLDSADVDQMDLGALAPHPRAAEEDAGPTEAKCIVCREKRCIVRIIPCNQTVLCVSCSRELAARYIRDKVTQTDLVLKCPVCRHPVTRFVDTLAGSVVTNLDAASVGKHTTHRHG